MIDITSFLLKHLYEFMADNYNATQQNQQAQQQNQRPAALPANAGDGDGHQLRRHHHCRPPPLSPASDDQREDQEPDAELEAAENNDAREGRQQLASKQVIQRTAAGQDLAQTNLIRNHETTHGTSSETKTTTTSDTDSSSSLNDTTQTEPHEEGAARPSSTLSAFYRFNYCQPREYAAQATTNRTLLAREQETNQQIVSFLINNQLPDLACETLIEVIFICVFLAVSWIFVMIIQLHCHQTSSHSLLDTSSSDAASPSYLYARDYYCNTKFLNSLMYCNNRNSLAVSS